MASLRTGESRRTVWMKESDCSIADFKSIVEHATDLRDFPLASEVVSGVVVYDGTKLPLSDSRAQDEIAAEWAYALSEGPGVFCVRGAFASQLKELDALTDAFFAVIKEEEEEAGGQAKGDHFAKAGANSRVWNALEKAAVRAPEAFVDYYSNPVIALASRGWLGPSYQLTSQVNVVRPGGEAQSPHRDYHLGFTTVEGAERYPAHAHTHLSPHLTLQGAIAHCDMPIESGPTILLPHSHKYALGYLAWRRQDFKDYILERSVQLPLRKGDAMFFNPALFHAGGGNTTASVQRIANLLQVSSGMGRAMETVNRQRVSLAVYPALLAMAKRQGCNAQSVQNVIAASAEGYPFPTNLDLDAPTGGLASETEAETLQRAVAEGWQPELLRRMLREHRARRRSQL